MDIKTELNTKIKFEFRITRKHDKRLEISFAVRYSLLVY